MDKYHIAESLIFLGRMTVILLIVITILVALNEIPSEKLEEGEELTFGEWMTVILFAMIFMVMFQQVEIMWRINSLKWEVRGFKNKK